MPSPNEASSASSPITACKKKLYALNPANPPQYVPTQRTRSKLFRAPADPRSLERQVRQMLAEKISGNQVGIWLLVPEHLRLGTWDLLLHWTGRSTARVEPRLALHLINEAAMCLCSYRYQRTLSQKGFEVANGLPFVPTDQAVHDLLESHTVAQAQAMQVGLGKLRRANRHFGGRLLALDPHRLQSHTRRQMRRHRFNATAKPAKMCQTFFLFDTQKEQPVCFRLASAAPSVMEVTPSLLAMAAEILPASASGAKPLILADKEHYSEELFRAVHQQGSFDLLCAMPAYPNYRKRWSQIPPDRFTEQWPGYATLTQDYRFKEDPDGWYYELVQRTGVHPADYDYQAFLSTTRRSEVQALTREYPQRWHVEEFFNFDQALGWHRAGTLNLNVRYGHMSLALLAQAAIEQLRQRLGPPFADWNATHFARNLFEGFDGDIRVSHDTILVTYYKAPNVERLRRHYEHLPEKLAREGINPDIPWLYNFKVDFRFK
jgi:hypothetical protein